MKVYFHGGPKNGQFEEIPDGRDWWEVYIPPVIEMTFKEKEVLAQPITPRIVTYVQARLGGPYGKAAIFQHGCRMFVPSNSVKPDGTEADHRWN